MGIHYRCHNENVGDLADLSHLDVKGNTGEFNPASVTADLFAEGNQQGQDENVKNNQDQSMLQPKFCIHRSHNGKAHDTDASSNDLHADVTEGIQIAGGTGDHQTAKGGGDEAKQQQNPVALADSCA